MNLRDFRIASGLAILVLTAGIGEAHADLRVCNQGANQVSIAFGYRADKGWQSEGWWLAGADKCTTIFHGDLKSRYFYLYVADDIGGGAWDGDHPMCTRDESFTIFGTNDCLARGYERTGFFEIDTQNRADWTVQLRAPVDGETASDEAALDEGAVTQ